MLLRTEVPLQSYPFEIDFSSEMLSLGSCFADNFGMRLKEHFFPILCNPFGLLFHPYPMAKALDRIMANQAYTKEELVLDQGMYHSMDHHGRFSNANSKLVVDQINTELREAHDKLKRAEVLVLTFGTSRVYHHLPSGADVANCHKIPQKQFEKRLTTANEMMQRWSSLIASLKAFNPKLKILVSLSPIRHIRDGLLENQVSKSHLRIFIQEMVDKNEHLFYFPAFELMMDDLRDYRFYKTDMTHPSDIALDYIWEYLSKAFFSEKTNSRLKQIEKLLSAAKHRPAQVASEQHQAFLKQQLAKLKDLQSSGLDLSQLQARFEKQLLK